MNLKSISFYLSLFCFPISILAFVNILYSSYFNYFLNRNNISEKELIVISEKALINDIFLKTINSSQGTSYIIANNIK